MVVCLVNRSTVSIHMQNINKYTDNCMTKHTIVQQRQRPLYKTWKVQRWISTTTGDLVSCFPHSCLTHPWSSAPSQSSACGPAWTAAPEIRAPWPASPECVWNTAQAERLVRRRAHRIECRRAECSCDCVAVWCDKHSTVQVSWYITNHSAVVKCLVHLQAAISDRVPLWHHAPWEGRSRTFTIKMNSMMSVWSWQWSSINNKDPRHWDWDSI